MPERQNFTESLPSSLGPPPSTAHAPTSWRGRVATLPALMGLMLAANSIVAAPRIDEPAPYVDEPMSYVLDVKYGAAARDRGVRLNALLNRLRGADVRTQLAAVNVFFNQFARRSDKTLWGKDDYWASPLEFLGRNGGDCEDFVISKYFALRSLGVPDRHLSMTYTRWANKKGAHMVLNYYETPGGDSLVLDDNQNTIRRATERTDLIPVYTFNATNLFLTKRSFAVRKTTATQHVRNSKWDKLLSQMERDRLLQRVSGRSPRPGPTAHHLAALLL